MIALPVILAVIGVTKISAIDHNAETILHDRFVKVKQAQTVEKRG